MKFCSGVGIKNLLIGQCFLLILVRTPCRSHLRISLLNSEWAKKLMQTLIKFQSECECVHKSSG